MTKYKYNFKKFFTTVEINHVIADSEFVTNGCFIVKRSNLRKPQNDLIEAEKENLFAQRKYTDEYIKMVYDTYKQAQDTADREDATEFIPAYIGTEIDKKTSEQYKVVMTENYKCIKEEYYNFFKDIKGKIFYYSKLPDYIPLPVYKDNEMIGLVFGVRLNNSISDKVKYQEAT